MAYNLLKTGIMFKQQEVKPMELKRAYELESSLKVTLVVRDEQVSETEEGDEEDSDSHNGHVGSILQQAGGSNGSNGPTLKGSGHRLPDICPGLRVRPGFAHPLVQQVIIL